MIYGSVSRLGISTTGHSGLMEIASWQVKTHENERITQISYNIVHLVNIEHSDDF